LVLGGGDRFIYTPAEELANKKLQGRIGSVQESVAGNLKMWGKRVTREVLRGERNKKWEKVIENRLWGDKKKAGGRKGMVYIS